MTGLRRYDLIAPGYDLADRWLYAGPRAHALALLGARPGETVLELGCGTGLNLPRLVKAVGDTGRIIGIDASSGMLIQAQRRIRDAGWRTVTLLHGDGAHYETVLRAAGIDPSDIDAVVATYVLSLLDDDAPLWRTLSGFAQTRPVRVALVDIGEPDAASAWQRPGWRLLARLGGVQARSPWCTLAQLASDTTFEQAHGGHVRIAVGTLTPGTNCVTRDDR